MILNIVLFFFIIMLIFIISAKCWSTFSKFHHNNHTFMDFIFISLYFLEQFSFLTLYYLAISYREIWVGLIVLITTTTASLDKLMMNSRQRKLSVILNNNILEKSELINTISKFEKENKELKSDNKIMEEILDSDLEEL